MRDITSPVLILLVVLGLVSLVISNDTNSEIQERKEKYTQVCNDHGGEYKLLQHRNIHDEHDVHHASRCMIDGLSFTYYYYDFGNRRFHVSHYRTVSDVRQTNAPNPFRRTCAELEGSVIEMADDVFCRREADNALAKYLHIAPAEFVLTR